MSTNRTPASYARAKLAGERQQAFTTAMTYARALRDLTRPGSVSPPPPRRQLAPPPRRQLAPLVHAWAEAMKHVLNAEE